MAASSGKPAPAALASSNDGSSETDSQATSSSSTASSSTSSSSSSSSKKDKPKPPAATASSSSLRVSPHKKGAGDTMSRSSSRIPKREQELGLRTSNPEMRASGELKEQARKDRTEEIGKEKSREQLREDPRLANLHGRSVSLHYITMIEKEKVELPACAPVTVAFSNLTYSVSAKGTQPDIEAGAHAEPDRKYLLKGLHGIVRPGQLLCVLGPSGSGKTTLLDILARRVSSGRKGGSVTLNGGEPNGDVFRSVCKYVPQEDSLIGSFTVKETLMYAARFWLSISEVEMEDRVHKLIKELGLEDARDTIIGTVFKKGISGGQKRRVSLGVELISNPSLLFLDEPTSGLDAAAAFHVMRILRNLCEAGRSVICTIHQPSSEIFHMSDNILLLSKGHQVYFGPSETVVSYFSSLGYTCPPATNPADYLCTRFTNALLNILNTDFPTHGDLNKIITSYKGSKGLQQIEAELKQITAQPIAKQPKPNVFWETITLMRRGAEYIVRNPGIYWVRLIMYVLLALMLGTLYLRMPYKADTIQDRISLLFFICAFMVFMSVAVLPQLRSKVLVDRPVFVRERANGSYGPLTYVLSQTVVSIPGLFLIAIVASAIVYWLCHLNPSGPRFGFFIADLFLSLFVAEGLIHLISACVPFFIIGLVAAAGIYGGFMLTEGFFLIKSNIPPWWIWMYYIGFHTYSFESFMYNEFHGKQFAWHSNMKSAWVPTTNSTNVVTGEEVLVLYEMNHDHRGRDMGILIAMAVIYRIGYYLVLKLMHSGKR